MGPKHNGRNNAGAGGGIGAPLHHSYMPANSTDTDTTVATDNDIDGEQLTLSLPSSLSYKDADVNERSNAAHYWKQFYANHCIYLPYMAGWFIFSSLLSTYNKVLFGSGQYHFPCPLLLTSLHFLVQWGFSYGLSNQCSDLFGGERVRSMSWLEFLQISIPCGIVSALDIGLSNMSLVRINLSLYTMIKSSTPVFVLIFAILFKLETISWGLFSVVFLITLGEYLVCAYGDLDFDSLGFMLCMGASVCSGARWTLVQFKLTTLDPPLKGSIPTMRVLTPSMFFSLLCIGIAVERPWNALNPKTSVFFQDFHHGAESVLAGLMGGLLAMCMVYFEFCLIIRSSAIVLMIGGVIKELLTLYIGAVVFGDNLNAKNILGCSIIFSGVVLYKCLLYLNHKKDPSATNKRDRSDNRNEDAVALVSIKSTEKKVSGDESSSCSTDSVRMRKHSTDGQRKGSAEII